MRIRVGPAAFFGAFVILASATPAARAQEATASADSGAQSQQPVAAAESSGPPIAYPKRQSLLAQTLGDIKAYYTAPLHWNARDWEYFGGAIAAIAVSDHYDTQARTHYDSGSSSSLGPPRSGEFTDALPGVAVLLGTWGYASLIHSPSGETEAGNMLESAGLSVVTSYALGYAFGRERPDQTTDANRWFHGGDSFPSEHVAGAFAIGTVLAESGNPEFRWIRRVLGYGIGLGTAYLRMRHNAHWLSDTVAGGALGMASAHFALNRSEQREAENFEFSLVPTRGGGVMLVYSLSE